MKVARLLFLILFPFIVHSQQYHNWVFGIGNGVAFRAGRPIVFNGTSIKSIEGTASISDEKGNLLFYTNGVTIYNRNHAVMENGNGLLGHESSFQPAVIIPQPANDSIFFVFTSDAVENNFKNGYHFSIVNIKKDGGLGAVIEKNTLLTSPSSERITSARHANGIDFWIIGNENNTNKFYSWKVTCTGIQPPIISTAGEVLNTHERVGMGALKISPDGSTLCQTHFAKERMGVDKNYFQLFDFDNNTGRITGGLKISLPVMNVYNAEFSPHSALLYVVDPQEQQIGQLSAKATSAADAINSFRGIPATFGFYGIQLAPNGKIYLANYTKFLSVINQPNLSGVASAFEQDALQLAYFSGLGLPAAGNDLNPDKNGFTYQIIDSCTGKVQFFGFTGNTGQTKWEWDFGDGSFSSVQSPQHTFADADSAYTVTVKITPANYCGYILKTKDILPGGYLAKASFNFTLECDSEQVTFQNTSIYADDVQFKWSFGDGTISTDIHPVHHYQQAGVYKVRLEAITPSSCVGSSELKTIELERPSVAVSSSKQEITETETLQLQATGNYKSITWTPEHTVISPQNSTTLASPVEDITYYAIVSNTAGCSSTDSVRIKVNPLSEIYVPTAFTPNGDGKNDVFKPAIGNRFGLRRFSIYNRWGTQVFQTADKRSGWDGNCLGVPQITGTYIWMIEIIAQSGKLIYKKVP